MVTQSLFQNLGIWEVTTPTYITNAATVTVMLIVILCGATVFARFETTCLTTQWTSHNGTCLVQMV